MPPRELGPKPAFKLDIILITAEFDEATGLYSCTISFNADQREDRARGSSGPRTVTFTGRWDAARGEMRLDKPNRQLHINPDALFIQLRNAAKDALKNMHELRFSEKPK